MVCGLSPRSPARCTGELCHQDPGLVPGTGRSRRRGGAGLPEEGQQQGQALRAAEPGQSPGPPVLPERGGVRLRQAGRVQPLRVEPPADVRDQVQVEHLGPRREPLAVQQRPEPIRIRGKRPRNPDLRRTTSGHVQLLSPVLPVSTAITRVAYRLRGVIQGNRQELCRDGWPRTGCEIGEFMQAAGIIAVPA